MVSSLAACWATSTPLSQEGPPTPTDLEQVLTGSPEHGVISPLLLVGLTYFVWRDSGLTVHYHLAGG